MRITEPVGNRQSLFDLGNLGFDLAKSARLLGVKRHGPKLRQSLNRSSPLFS